METFTAADVENMTEGSPLFKAIRSEMKKRGCWKSKNRGANIREVIKKRLVNGVNTITYTSSNLDDEFSDGM